MERKVVLITGGAMGQGKAHALKYAQNGFDVVLADMQDPEGETFKATVAEVEAVGVKALAVKCNVCSDEDMQNLFTSATAFFSLFALPLTSQFGWSSSEFSMAYTIYMFVYCAMGFVGGLLAEKLQPRVAIYLGLVFFSAGWFLTGFASSIPQLYLFYAILAALAVVLVFAARKLTASMQEKG